MRRDGSFALSVFLCMTPAFAGVPLTTELVLDGLPGITGVTHAPGDVTRLFVLQRSGRIWIIKNGALLETPFLDITGQVNVSGERGMLGLAFHPQYDDNGFFYVRFNHSSGDTIVRQYAASPGNPDLANPAAALQILNIDNQTPNHNGGWIEFGDDGYLYVAVGNDTNSDASQDLNDLHGKILRIDVNVDDFPDDSERNYGIPATNPLRGVEGADEIWGGGLRNPWQCAIDHDADQIWIADVGDFDYEEVSVQQLPLTPLYSNFGYACMEGLHCTPDPICDCDDPSLIDPIFEYTHGQGCAIIGGRIYRGCAIPKLQGTYFCADFCSDTIWSMELVNGQAANIAQRQKELIDPDGSSINQICAFGEDGFGELHICSLSGAIYKIVPAIPPLDANQNGVPDACEPVMAGDVTGDGVVDTDDLLAVLTSWGPCWPPPPCAADPTGDGTVDVDDLLLVIVSWSA